MSSTQEQRSRGSLLGQDVSLASVQVPSFGREVSWKNLEQEEAFVKSEMTDEDLIARYYDGDNTAFDEIDKRYRKKLFAFFKDAMSHDDAEDLAARALAKIIITTSRYSPEEGASFHTWVFFHIAANLLRDFLRKKGREVTFTEEENEEEMEKVPFEEQIEETPFSYRPLHLDQAAEVKDCLSKLTKEERLFISLRVEGFQQQEIAKRLEIANSTVTKLKERAEKKLRQCLEKKDLLRRKR